MKIKNKDDNRVRLRSLIDQAGWTQKQTAAALGVHLNTVPRWLMEAKASRRAGP